MKILKSDIYAKQKFKAGDLVRVVGKRPVGRITYMPASYNKKSIEFRSPNGNFSLIMDIPIDLLEKADKRDRFIFELDLNKNDYKEIRELKEYVNNKKQEMRNDL